MEQLTIVKIGGNVTDDPAALAEFLTKFVAIEGHKILVHGGGKTTTTLCKKLNIPQTIVENKQSNPKQ